MELNVYYSIGIMFGCVYLSPGADAIRCYSCNSETTGQEDTCGDDYFQYIPVEQLEYSVVVGTECPQTNSMCVKLETQVESIGVKHMQRYCVNFTEPEGCRRMGSGFTTSRICFCSTDLCNGAMGQRTCNIWLMLPMTFLAILLTHRTYKA